MKPRAFVAVALLACVLVGCANDQSVSNSAPAAKIEKIGSAEELKTVVDGDAVVIHALDREHYAKGHVPGAVNVDYEKMTAEMLPADKATPLVFYCAGGGCPVSKMAANKAAKWGYKKVSVFEGGIKAWQSAGMAVATGE